MAPNNDEEHRLISLEIEEVPGLAGAAESRFPRLYKDLKERDELFPIGINQNEFPFSSRIDSYFNDLILEIRDRARRIDVRDSNEFHGLLWLISRLGPTVPKTLSKEFKAADAQVSRWCQAKVTPRGNEKRQRILRAALAALVDDLHNRRQPLTKRDSADAKAGSEPTATLG